MELTYQREIIMPAQCCALSEEEMTYLCGGDYTFSVGKYNVTVHPEVLGEYLQNLSINLIYAIGMGATSAALAGIIKGYQDGDAGAAISKFWNNQNTAGRVAAVVVGAFAGYYIYVQALSVYSTVVSVVDSMKEWWASRQADTAAAA